jgi:NADH:ubiquinone oxidoreductase subunit C
MTMAGEDRSKERMHLRSKVEKMAKTGARFSTLVGVDDGDGNLEVIYLFDHQGDLLTLRTTYGLDEVIPSISDVYPAAEVIERELVDLFGVTVEGREPWLLLTPESGVRAPLRKSFSEAPGEEREEGKEGDEEVDG